MRHLTDLGLEDSNMLSGGKVKPLKAPKKEKKDMDEDEVAFKAKQAAGATTPITAVHIST